MNWHATAGGSLLPGIAEPEVASRTAVSTEATEGDWLCAWCLNRVANDRDRFTYNGQDEFTFTNPEGIRFDIITFLQAPGCGGSGVPTLEYTWFAGHAWSFSICGQCGRHLGWFYDGPHHFVGLIKERIVRAALIRN